MPEIVTRAIDPQALARLVSSGCDPRLARLYAARGVGDPAELAGTLPGLVPPSRMARIEEAAVLLAGAIAAGERLLILADYDADGATACAVGVRGLRSLGAKVEYLVPNRFAHGYGLTPEIVREAAERKPDWLITVDNGIAAVSGVEEANRLGMRVLVTDHHLPGAELPAAACIVNPNQVGCAFPSKALAGVGVIFYVLLALRTLLRSRGAFASRAEPNFAGLLDIVALGTVADVVPLDANNRILVSQGLARIRSGKGSPGILALFEAAGRPWARATAYDLGFVAGPRLNAAGRLKDMSLGIECLLADDPVKARALARQLDALNRERREIEGEMQAAAVAMLEGLEPAAGHSLTVHDPSWHPGVVGLLASRLKDRYHRPVFAFAQDGSGMLKGSGRSIAGLHLRDALDLVDKRCPGVLERFGGHAAAAGASLREAALPAFREAFEAVAREKLSPADLELRLETDGDLAPDETSFEFAQLLRTQVWGQAFPEPRFTGRFGVESQRVVGARHAKLVLLAGGHRFHAMRFGSPDPLPESFTAVFRLDVNEYQGNESLQLLLDHVEQ